MIYDVMDELKTYGGKLIDVLSIGFLPYQFLKL